MANGNEDWNEFKNKLIKMFQSIHLEDEQAADQFCTYLEGNAYRHWNSLPRDVQSSFPKVLSAFDKKFENNHRQGSWQIQYENMTYLGPDKETLDELATRIKDIVNKAYPDIIRKGVVHSKKEQRKSNARRKFWDLMPDNIQKQLFIKFGSCDAPLKQQLEYAQRIEASDLRARKGEQSYMQICAMEPQNNAATDALMQTVSTALNAVTQQNKELVQLVERQSTNNKQETKPPRKPTWQQPQQQQNWQTTATKLAATTTKLAATTTKLAATTTKLADTTTMADKIMAHSNKRNPKPRNNHNNRHNTTTTT